MFEDKGPALGAKDQDRPRDLESFAAAVSDYSVFGMIPRNTRIGNLVVNPTGDNGFSIWGTDSVMFWDGLRGPHDNLTNKFFQLLRAAAKDHRNETSQLTKRTHYLALLETTKDVSAAKYRTYPEGAVIFAYGFVYDPGRQDNRGLVNAVTGVVMERNDAVELVEEIKEDPQFLEDFYQRIFAGLDSRQDIQTGMLRRKADGVVILDREVLEKLPEIDQYERDAFPVDLIRGLERYKFSTPVGVV